MERILGERLCKVKVARLFLVTIAEVFIDCDYFATGGSGIGPVMGDQKGGQSPLPDSPEDEVPELVAQGLVQPPEGLVQQEGAGLGEQHAQQGHPSPLSA